jgi:cytoskeleton protein RodZ
MASPNRKQSQNDIFDPTVEGKAEVIAMPAPEMPQERQPTERQSRQATMRVGEVLKRERERRGYDLQQIADYLCIRRGLLSAIENSRYEEFPADAYVIGFLRSYADLIGLDGQEAINHYRQEMAGRRRKPDLILPTPISEGRAPTAVIMGAAALASLMIYILWYAFSTNDRTTVTTPQALPTALEAPSTMTSQQTMAPVTAETIPATTPSGIAIAAPAPTQQSLAPATPTNGSSAAPQTASATATPVTSSAHIVIKADQSSWILISSATGQTVYDHVMKPGEIYQVPNDPGLTLTTGNGAGIVVTLDGVDLPRLASTTSHIVRNVPLETKALKSLPRE